MSRYFRPDHVIRERIEQAVQAGSNMCWTCGSCDFECPMNQATGSLRPQKVVRLATMGMLEELQKLPEIWYCLSCRRCNQICPNSVKPAPLIEFARRQAVGCGLVSTETYRHFRSLFSLFQRVRWHATAFAMQNALTSLSHERWCRWLEMPVPEDTYTLMIKHTWMPDRFKQGSHPQACFTCGECSSACPVSGERSVFDPRTVFRMLNMGLIDKLMTSPAIWLCIDCRRCSDACSQLVEGHAIIGHLRRLALENGAVDIEFPDRLAQANRLIYTRLLDEIDMLLGIETRRTARPAVYAATLCEAAERPCQTVTSMIA
jgi:heterodisulfide reductase subunit C